jgi:hypothetical protein
MSLFGKTPLFFYIVHLYVYSALSKIPWPQDLIYGYMVWILGLAIMVPLCLFFLEIKVNKGRSLRQLSEPLLKWLNKRSY